MNRSPVAFVFDFGGVVINWNPRHLYRKVFNGDEQAVEQFLSEINFHEWNLKQDYKRVFAEGVPELCNQFPQHTALIQLYNERWEESIAGPIQGTVDLLWALNQRGYPLYGLTNWSADKFLLTRVKYSFFSWFQDIVVSGEVNLVKPDPRIFKLLLDRIGRRAEECVLIDDSQANLVAAHDLGFSTIKFESPAQLERELQERGFLR